MSSVLLPFGRFQVLPLRPGARLEAPLPRGTGHARRLGLGAVMLASPELQAHLHIHEEDHDWDALALGGILLDTLADSASLSEIDNLALLGLALLRPPSRPVAPPEPTPAPPRGRDQREPAWAEPEEADPLPGLTLRGLNYPRWRRWARGISPSSDQWKSERSFWREAAQLLERDGAEALAAWVRDLGWDNVEYAAP